jgi:hypothetical protein
MRSAQHSPETSRPANTRAVHASQVTVPALGRPQLPVSFFAGTFFSIIFIVEGLVVKSFYFLNNDPVLAHYALSAAISACALMVLFFSVGFRAVSSAELILFTAAIVLSFTSSLASGQVQNLIASCTFTLSVMMCYFAVPRLLAAVRVDLIKFLRLLMGAITVGSAILAVTVPALAWDPKSGRFSGVMISVAVACNIFFLASALFADQLRAPQNWKWRTYTAGLLGLAFVFLFLTYTRNLILQAVVLLVLFALTSQSGKIRLRSALTGFVVLLCLIFTGLLYQAVVGVDLDNLMVSFRLADGGSATDSRMTNWLFALDRIYEAPWFGEGMLTKQLAGGDGLITDTLGTTYNPLYDPHSLPLSLAVQAGIPFAVTVLILLINVFLQHLRVFGLMASIGSVAFMTCAVTFVGMFPGGGDLTSMGNATDRIFWIMLGWMALRVNQATARGTSLPVFSQHAMTPRREIKQA